ncbi:MAG: radical SAM protein [Candidatus Helarchaeota archaeon]|nr:radical SAM protein [Candidatus Helarchaeota archaeon]
MVTSSNIKNTKSLCPECKKTIDAKIIEENGKVLMNKKCSEHGNFSDILSINPTHFRWSQQFMLDGQKPRNPCVPIKKGCPNDCGACPNHKSSPACAVVDVTYRCNLKCPICFANAEAKGMNLEPSFEELIRIFRHFRNIKPQPPIVAMYAGGEPTMRNDMPDLLSECVKMGFQQLQIATNGIRLTNIDYFQELIDAGLPNTTKNNRTRTIIYFQFDGIVRETYLKTRGVDILDKKLKVIENARELNFPNLILVPTIARGVNDHEITNILQFAIDNIDVVNTVMYQPMAMCGRFDKDKLHELRITSSHLAKELHDYTNGKVGKTYPISTISKFAKIIAWLNNEPPVEFTCNVDCGFANFMFVNPQTKQLTGIEDFVDSEKFLKISSKWYDRVEREKNWEREGNTGIFGNLFGRARKDILKARIFGELALALKGPQAILNNFSNPIQLISSFADTILNTSWESSSNWLIDNNILLVGLMHFQDLYNFDLERVSRCLVHYGYIDPATNQVRQVPFCAMNAVHRERIENELEQANKMVQYVPEVKSN